MERTVRLLLIAASLRKDSLNARLLQNVRGMAEKRGAVADVVAMSELDCPSYDGDLEVNGIPDGARRLREHLLACDAFILSSPEYNASMPGVLKNVIDWTSRFRPQPFNGKQAFLMSASPSMVGGNRGLWSLRIPLEHLGVRVYPDMFSLAQAHTMFDEAGRFTETRLRDRLDGILGCFLDLVEAAKNYPVLRKEWIEFLGEKPDPAVDRVETNDIPRSP